MSETQARLLFLERKKQRTFHSRGGAQAAPSSPAIFQFCVRGFLRCRKRKLGFFSLKERSKELLRRGAGREPPLRLPRFYGFVSAVFCGVGNISSASSRCKERSKELFIRGAGREPPLCLPRFYFFVSAFFCGVGYLSSASSRCKERSKELFIRGAGREPPLHF